MPSQAPKSSGPQQPEASPLTWLLWRSCSCSSAQRSCPPLAGGWGQGRGGSGGFEPRPGASRGSRAQPLARRSGPPPQVDHAHLLLGGHFGLVRPLRMVRRGTRRRKARQPGAQHCCGGGTQRSGRALEACCDCCPHQDQLRVLWALPRAAWRRTSAASGVAGGGCARTTLFGPQLAPPLVSPALSWGPL